MNSICLSLEQDTNIYFLLDKEKFVSCSSQQPKDLNGTEIQAQNVSLSNLAQDKAQDIVVLFTRKRGEFFQLGENNRLAVFSGWNLKKRYQWTRGEKQQRVQQVVSDAIKALQQALPQGESNNKEPLLQKVLRASFFRDFRGSIGALSKKTFDRYAIERGGALEKYLAPESFFAAEQELKEKILSSQGKSLRERKQDIVPVFYKFCYQESLFAHQLGLRFQRMGAGSGGACKGVSRSGHTLVIRKAGDEGPYGVNNPSMTSRIKRLILSPRACLVGNSEPRAERSSYQLSEVLGLDNVPPTYVENSRGRECSVQLFVSEAQSLGDALNISSIWHMVPRCLRSVLRSQLQLRKDIHERPDEDLVPEVQEGAKKSPFATILKQVGTLRTKILKKIFSPLPEMPQRVFEQAAISKYLSGDIDTHFGNMLSKKLPDHHVDFFTQQLDEGAVDQFIRGMYTHTSTHHRLLDSLLFNEQGSMIVNHDGGAAFVHQHNREGGIDGYLSGRYRCLFEVLPVCSEGFSEATKKHFVNNEQEQNKHVVKFILAQSLQELLARFEKDLPTFIEFWTVEHNRCLFKQWILGQGDHLQEICRSFAMIKFKDPKTSRYAFASYESRVQDNLELIQGTCTTLMDRYRLLMQHLKMTPDAPMRDVFLLIDEEQIQEKIAQVKGDEFSKLLAKVAVASVGNCGNLPTSLHDLQNSYSSQVDLLYGA